MSKMTVKITTKRQATFPAHVLDTLGVGPGDRLELREEGDGYLLKPLRIDESLLGGLRGRLKRGRGAFDLEAVREAASAPSLRD